MLEAYFDYRTYLSLAEAMSAGALAPAELRDARLRSAISRCYYAAFLSARQYQPDREIHHGELIAWVRRHDKELGRDFEQLKSFREDCDYDKPIAYDLHDKAQEVIDTVREVVERLEELFSA